MKLTAAELNGTHLGKVVTVERGDHLTINGPLKGIEHEAELIWDAALCGPTRFALGRPHVRLAFLDPDAQVTVAATTEVEVTE